MPSSEQPGGPRARLLLAGVLLAAAMVGLWVWAPALLGRLSAR